MAAKKVLFLIDDTSESLKTLLFAARYFNPQTTHLTFFTPFTSENSSEPSRPSEVFRFLITSGVKEGMLSSSELNRLSDTLENFVAHVHNLDNLGKEAKSHLMSHFSFCDLIIGAPGAFDFWNTRSMNYEGRPGGLKIKLSGECCDEINRIVILNDGSDQSLGTIQEFSRLFNDTFVKTEINLLITNPEYRADDQVHIVRFLHAHFKNLAYHVLSGEEPHKLRSYLGVNDNTLILNVEGTNMPLVKKYFTGDNLARLSNIY